VSRNALARALLYQTLVLNDVRGLGGLAGQELELRRERLGRTCMRIPAMSTNVEGGNAQRASNADTGRSAPRSGRLLPASRKTGSPR
jgi:hypothetical protein